MKKIVLKSFVLLSMIASSVAIYPMFPLYTVQPGTTAIHLRCGRIVGSYRENGLYTKVPLLDSIVKIPNGIQKSSIETKALSKDLQAISIGVDVNYRVTDEVQLYKLTQNNAERIILIPFCHETIKAVIAQYTAEELIQERQKVKEAIYKELQTRLRPHFMEFVEVNFAHADFSPDFIKAVEEKQIAHQNSIKEKNYTESVKEKATQQKLTADAEAYAQQVKKQHLTQELVMLEAIRKWDGKLPQVASSANVPFLNLHDLKATK